jgi:hypothetical protein
MTELAAVSRDEFDPEGKPDASEGRFDNYFELIAQCDG